MALPWIIGGAALVAGKLLYDAVTDDDSSSSSHNDREEREREAQRRAKEEKNKKIREEISQYKEAQKEEIENKYKVFIEFISEDSTQNDIHVIDSMFWNFTMRNEDKVKIISKDETLQNRISDLKNETTELEEAIKELEDIKNETLK